MSVETKERHKEDREKIWKKNKVWHSYTLSFLRIKLTPTILWYDFAFCWGKMQSKPKVLCCPFQKAISTILGQGNIVACLISLRSFLSILLSYLPSLQVFSSLELVMIVESQCKSLLVLRVCLRKVCLRGSFSELVAVLCSW